MTLLKKISLIICVSRVHNKANLTGAVPHPLTDPYIYINFAGASHLCRIQSFLQNADSLCPLIPYNITRTRQVSC